MIDYANHINETAHSLSCSKILIQGSDLTMQLDAYDTVIFAEKMDQISLALKGLRLATVSSSKNAEARSFVETALLNRSVSYKVFTKVEDAITYLLTLQPEENSPTR
jgi:hypothetical protein